MQLAVLAVVSVGARQWASQSDAGRGASFKQTQDRRSTPGCRMTGQCTGGSVRDGLARDRLTSSRAFSLLPRSEADDMIARAPSTAFQLPRIAQPRSMQEPCRHCCLSEGAAPVPLLCNVDDVPWCWCWCWCWC